MLFITSLCLLPSPENRPGTWWHHRGPIWSHSAMLLQECLLRNRNSRPLHTHGGQLVWSPVPLRAHSRVWQCHKSRWRQWLFTLSELPHIKTASHLPHVWVSRGLIWSWMVSPPSQAGPVCALGKKVYADQPGQRYSLPWAGLTSVATVSPWNGFQDGLPGLCQCSLCQWQFGKRLCSKLGIQGWLDISKVRGENKLCSPQRNWHPISLFNSQWEQICFD